MGTIGAVIEGTLSGGAAARTVVRRGLALRHRNSDALVLLQPAPGTQRIVGR